MKITETLIVIESITIAATIENAANWAKEQEQFLFCDYLLDLPMSTHYQTLNNAVDMLESKFEKLLGICK
jgi:hypothetical protein